jgi:hypothetical protein
LTHSESSSPDAEELRSPRLRRGFLAIDLSKVLNLLRRRASGIGLVQ